MTVLSKSGVWRKKAAISRGVSPSRPIFCISATPFLGFLLNSAMAR